MPQQSESRVYHITDEKLRRIQALTNPKYGANPAEVIENIAEKVADRIYYKTGLARSGISVVQFKEDLLAKSTGILREYNPNQQPRPMSFDRFVWQRFEWRAITLLKSRQYRRRVNITEEAVQKILKGSPKKMTGLDPDEIETVREAVKVLPEKYRGVVTDYYGMNGRRSLSHIEIGRKYGFSNATSCRTLHKAHEMLKIGPLGEQLKKIHANMGRARRG